MKYTRIYTGKNMQSHFEELSLALHNSQYGKLSNVIGVENITFGQIDDIDEVNWHNPPHPQYIIMLQGAMEIEIGDGTKKIFREGDIVLAEDTDGQGHITRAASSGARKYLTIKITETTKMEL